MSKINFSGCSEKQPNYEVEIKIRPDDKYDNYAFEIDSQDRLFICGCDCAAQLEDVPTAEQIHEALGKWIERRKNDNGN